MAPKSKRHRAVFMSFPVTWTKQLSVLEQKKFLEKISLHLCEDVQPRRLLRNRKHMARVKYVHVRL